MDFDQLVNAAARVGVVVTPTEVSDNLYVWHTPEREVVYIGKSASSSRTRNETKWRGWNPRERIYSGIVSLLSVNNALLQPIRYEENKFDAARCLSQIEADRWSGSAVDTLRAYLAEQSPTAQDVEKLLIRICVRYGVPIGNSQFASQWETPIGSPMDTMAAISAYADEKFRP